MAHLFQIKAEVARGKFNEKLIDQLKGSLDMPNSARNTDILSVVKQKTLSKSQKSSIPRGLKLNHNKKASFDLLHSPVRSFETFDNRKVFKSPVINGFNGLNSINESLAERVGPF